MSVQNGDFVTVNGKKFRVGEMISLSYDEKKKRYEIVFEDSKGDFHSGLIDEIERMCM